MAALAALVVLSRRLSDRIRELCTQAANAGDANFAEVLSELQSALHEPAARAREMGIRQIAGRKERRLRKEPEESCVP
jgi:IS5 family transposase